jgi:hypothetical protein
MRVKDILIASLILGTSISGCTGSATPEPTGAVGGEFAIYLPAEDLTMDDMVDLSQVELSEIPVISSDDIVAYDSATHVIELNPSMAVLLDALELPGRPFVVTVGRTPIYAGAFMAAFFSRSYDGVVILWPPMDGSIDTITIQLGYPGSDFFSGEDPRSDARIIESLRQAGKLR